MSVSSRCRWRTRADVHWIAQTPCVAVLPAGDPLAAQPRIALRDLARRRIVTVANRHRLRQRIDAAFAAARVDARVFIETNASLNAVMAARAGIGIGIVDPATGVALPVEGVVARPLDVDIRSRSASRRPPATHARQRSMRCSTRCTVRRAHCSTT